MPYDADQAIRAALRRCGELPVTPQDPRNFQVRIEALEGTVEALWKELNRLKGGIYGAEGESTNRHFQKYLRRG